MRVVRAICVTCLAVGSVTCILVALLGPRTSSMKIPLLSGSAAPLAQLTLDDSLRKPSSSAPTPPLRKAHAAKGHAAKAHAAAAPDGGTCYTFGHNARGECKLPVPWVPDGCRVFTESLVLATARALASSPLKAAGYDYINLDCGWSTGLRDASKNLVVNRTKFPNGLLWLSRQVHSMGL